ncbi:MAG: hypothetical protein ACOCRK_10655, partial [bacterium]
MKKKLCVATYVFGELYQQYIPIYIYSLLKNYPEYTPIIFSELPLKVNIKKQLEIVRELGDFTIYESYSYGYYKLMGQRAEALRWLLIHKNFYNYNAVYIGDIDIFFAREIPPIYDQHIKHCDVIGLPYSNIVRVFKKNRDINEILNSCKESGIIGVFYTLINISSIDKKLTGLHF